MASAWCFLIEDSQADESNFIQIFYIIKSKYKNEVKLVTGTKHMTNEQIYKDVEKEIVDEQKKLEEVRKAEEVDRIKRMVKDILQKMQEQKKKKEEAEESLRILKLDLDDLRAGKIEKINERHQSKRATEIIPFPVFPDFPTLNPSFWLDATSGTYPIWTDGITKTYFL